MCGSLPYTKAGRNLGWLKRGTQQSAVPDSMLA